MFPDLRLTTAVVSTPPRLIFLSRQIDMIIVIFALMVPMFPDLRLTTAVVSTPPRLIFLSLQIDMIIVIFALMVTVSVR